MGPAGRWNAAARSSDAGYGNLRYLHEFASLTARYNVNRTSRFEFRGGVRRTGYGWQTLTRVTNIASRKVVSSVTQGRPAGAPSISVRRRLRTCATRRSWGRQARSLANGYASTSSRRSVACCSPMFAWMRGATSCRCAPSRSPRGIQHTGRYGPDAADGRLHAAAAWTSNTGSRIRHHDVCGGGVRSDGDELLDPRRAHR